MKNKKGNKYTIIIGCGRLGVSLATEIYDFDSDVLVIDVDEKAFQNLPSNFGGLTLTSNGTDIDTLEKANIQNATSLICVTNDDNVNIMASLIAKELFNVKKVIARVYLPERESVYRDLGVETICPTRLSVKAIQNLLVENDNEEENK